MERIGGLGYIVWWQQAILFAVVGSGTLYRAATGQDRWQWWLLATAAWLGFIVESVFYRKPICIRSTAMGECV